jgi:hypothetical protein
MDHSRSHEKVIKKHKPGELLVSMAPDGPQEYQRIPPPLEGERQAKQKERVNDWYRILASDFANSVRMLSEKAAPAFSVEERSSKLPLRSTPVMRDNCVPDPSKAIAAIC